LFLELYDGLDGWDFVINSGALHRMPHHTDVDAQRLWVAGHVHTTQKQPFSSIQENSNSEKLPDASFALWTEQYLQVIAVLQKKNYMYMWFDGHPGNTMLQTDGSVVGIDFEASEEWQLGPRDMYATWPEGRNSAEPHYPPCTFTYGPRFYTKFRNADAANFHYSTRVDIYVFAAALLTIHVDTGGRPTADSFIDRSSNHPITRIFKESIGATASDAFGMWCFAEECDPAWQKLKQAMVTEGMWDLDRMNRSTPVDFWLAWGAQGSKELRDVWYAKWDGLDVDLRDMIEVGLKCRDADRPTATELLEHPYFKKQPWYGAPALREAAQKELSGVVFRAKGRKGGGLDSCGAMSTRTRGRLAIGLFAAGLVGLIVVYGRGRLLRRPAK
jgi:serine/threonine protein kinase